MNAAQLRSLVIQPTLQYIGLDSREAQNLLLGTLAQESSMAEYLKQIEGEALSPWMIEKITFEDITGRFLNLSRNGRLRQKVMDLTTIKSHGFDFQDIIGNLPLACAIARIKYFMSIEALPAQDDILGMAKYYKKHYNTYEGKATESQFIENYKRYVLT